MKTKNLIDNQSKATERFLQGFLDMNNDFDEWKKKHPDGNVQDFLVLQEENEAKV